MEEKFMNKRFNIFCAYDEANGFADNYDVLQGFLEDVVKKENRKAYKLYDEIFCGRSHFDAVFNVYHFNRNKKFYKYWSDEEITEAFKTLMKYGFLDKLDNNGMMFHINGNAFKEKKESAYEV